MPWHFDVPMLDKSTYRVKRLLAKGSQNTKTAKSDKAGVGILTYSLSLAPASVSGFNLCSSSSHACRFGCLFTSGYARVNPRAIQPARIAKSRLFKLNSDEFGKRLTYELALAHKMANRKGLRLFVRLNVLSDVFWERSYPALFTQFPNVTFYDYTKHFPRMLRFLNRDFPANYHLTFSWSGENLQECMQVLKGSGNVAVPFDVKYAGEKRRPLPPTWYGHPIIDGDITDLRPLDPQGGYVVGLRAKGDAKLDKTSGFVILVKEGKAFRPLSDGTLESAD